LIQDQGQTRNLDSKIYLPAIVSNSNHSFFAEFNSIGQTQSFGDVGSMSGLPESGHDWPIL